MVLPFRHLVDPLVWGFFAFLVSILVITQPITATGVLITLVAIAIFTLVGPRNLLGIMLVIAPLRVLIATEAPGQFPADVGQLLLAALLFSWLIHTIAIKRTLPRLQPSSIMLFVGVFLLALTVTAASAFSLTVWLSEWLKWVQVAVLVIIVLDLFQNDQWQTLVLFLAFAGTANAIIGIYQFFGGSGALHLLVEGRYFRAFGTFGQPNPFGGFMGLIAPIAMMATVAYLLRLWDHWRISRRIPIQGVLTVLMYGSMSLLIVIGLYMSWSRGAWLGFAASVAAMGFMLPRRWWQRMTLVGGGLAVLLGLWGANAIPQSITTRLSSITAETFNVSDVRGVDITPANYAIVERLAHWQAALRMVEANPALGVGAGNYEVAYETYRLMNWPEALGHAHNYYLNVLAETGIMGFIAYITMWVGIITLTWLSTRSHDQFARCTAIGLMGSWVYLSVHSLTDNLYVNNIFLHTGILMGLLAVLYRQRTVPVVVESL